MCPEGQRNCDDQFGCECAAGRTCNGKQCVAMCEPNKTGACGSANSYCDGLDQFCKPCPAGTANCDGVGSCEACALGCEGSTCAERRQDYYIAYDGTEYKTSSYIGRATYRERHIQDYWTCQNCTRAQAEEKLRDTIVECKGEACFSGADVCPNVTCVEHHFYETNARSGRECSACDALRLTDEEPPYQKYPWPSAGKDCGIPRC